jgi:hypothetical protein
MQSPTLMACETFVSRMDNDIKAILSFLKKTVGYLEIRQNSNEALSK